MPRPDRTALALLAMLPAVAHAQPAGTIGPSFACPAPHDPLAQLICDSAELSRHDLIFVQVYQAYRQSLPPDGQKALLAESRDFARAVRAGCGMANARDSRPPPDAVPCVDQAYTRQIALWEKHLSGPAAEEARRPVQQHLALQQDLQRLGLLPSDQMIDGVFGSTTRTAIMAFQKTMDLPATGLLGDHDAAILEREVATRESAAPVAAPVEAPVEAPVGAPAGAPPSRSQWDAFQSEALAIGIAASLSLTAETCMIQLDVQQPGILGKAVRAVDRGLDNGTDDSDEPHLFKATLEFLQTRVAAKAVHAAYASAPQADACVIGAAAFTTDIYGRDERQPLFSLGFDRATYARIVWERFDPANLPRIALSSRYGSYAQDRLRGIDARAKPQAASGPVTPAGSGPSP